MLSSVFSHTECKKSDVHKYKCIILMLLNEEVIKCIKISHECKLEYKQISQKLANNFLSCSSHIIASERQLLMNKSIVRSVFNSQ